MNYETFIESGFTGNGMSLACHYDRVPPAWEKVPK